MGIRVLICARWWIRPATLLVTHPTTIKQTLLTHYRSLFAPSLRPHHIPLWLADATHPKVGVDAAVYGSLMAELSLGEIESAMKSGKAYHCSGAGWPQHWCVAAPFQVSGGRVGHPLPVSTLGSASG